MFIRCKMAQSEPLLQARLTLFPIRFPQLDLLTKKHRSTYWTPEEIAWDKDALDWKVVTDNERHMLKLVLSFFAVADGIVMENVNDNFAQEIKAPEARNFYAVQNCIESIHVEQVCLEPPCPTGVVLVLHAFH